MAPVYGSVRGPSPWLQSMAQSVARAHGSSLWLSPWPEPMAPVYDSVRGQSPWLQSMTQSVARAHGSSLWLSQWPEPNLLIYVWSYVTLYEWCLITWSSWHFDRWTWMTSLPKSCCQTWAADTAPSMSRTVWVAILRYRGDWVRLSVYHCLALFYPMVIPDHGSYLYEIWPVYPSHSVTSSVYTRSIGKGCERIVI